MGAGPFVIPLVALAIPIALLLGALVFDAALISWVMYRAWHKRPHGYLWRMLHRSP